MKERIQGSKEDERRERAEEEQVSKLRKAQRNCGYSTGQHGPGPKHTSQPLFEHRDWQGSVKLHATDPVDNTALRLGQVLLDATGEIGCCRERPNFRNASGLLANHRDD